MERPSIHLAWQRFVDRYNAKVQQLKVDMPNDHEGRLRKELALEKSVIVGIEAIDSTLALSGAFEEEATHQ